MPLALLPMDRLDINPRIITALKRAQLTNLEKLVCMSGTEIERRTNVSASDAAILLKAVADLLILQPIVPASLLIGPDCPPCHRIPRLSCGCTVLDTFLRGGLLCRGITEICGESAAGKTQWCLQLCLTVQLPTHMGGLNAGAVYVCTEDVFPNKRLMQMVGCAKQKYSDLKINWTDNIFIEHIAEIEDLEICIAHRLPALLSQGKVKLVIIDSIAALFRCEYGLKDMPKRAKLLSSFGSKLRTLSSKHGCAVVCVNQVSAVIDPSGSKGPRANNIQPALGISWSNLVTCRLMLSRSNSAATAGPPERKLSITFAPHLPNDSRRYMITNAGVKGIT